MENHNFEWENSLFQWPISIAMLHYQRVYSIYYMFTQYIHVLLIIYPYQPVYMASLGVVVMCLEHSQGLIINDDHVPAKMLNHVLFFSSPPGKIKLHAMLTISCHSQNWLEGKSARNLHIWSYKPLVSLHGLPTELSHTRTSHPGSSIHCHPEDRR